MAQIEIRQIMGVFRNADMEDVSAEMAESLVNFMAQNGKIVKTFGIGDRFDLEVMNVIENNSVVWDDDEVWTDHEYWVDSEISDLAKSIGESIQDVVVFKHHEFACPIGSGVGFAIIVVLISNEAMSEGLVSLKYWDGDSWADISNMIVNTLGSFYQKRDSNCIVQHNEILRLLPGNVGEIDGHEAKGIWLGYIGRDYFDGQLLAGSEQEVNEGDADFKAGYRVYDAELTKPDIEFTVIQIQGGEYSPSGGGADTKYYKVSELYDGEQESPLSEPIAVIFDFANNLFLRLNYTFVLNVEGYNFRKTGMKIYRADAEEGPYSCIHTIDFTRDSDEIYSKSNGAYSGSNTVYIPELTSYNFDGVSTYTLYLRTSNTSFVGANLSPIPSGTGNVIFHIGSDGWNNDLWDVGWMLYKSGVVVEGNDGGAYAGDQCIIVNEDVGEYSGGGVLRVEANGGLTTNAAAVGTYQTDFTCNNHGLEVGDVVVMTGFTTNPRYNGTFVVKAKTANTFTINAVFGSNENGNWKYIGDYRLVETTYKYAIHLKDRYSSDYTGVAEIVNALWVLMAPSKGLYEIDVSQVVAGQQYGVTIDFFDNNLSGGASHSYVGDDKIKVNGKFSVMLKGRLFLFNIVLDPGGVNEVHEDWLAYSELDQPDSIPVSNVIPILDWMSGEGTGMAISFGSLILFKKYSAFKLHVVDIDDVSTWKLSDSVFNRGNVAKKGLVQVGHVVYFCAYDGIYKLDLNFEAAADETPLINARISEPINDVYLALDDEGEKPYIKAGYDRTKTEIVYQFKSGSIWAYNIRENAWRQIESDVEIDLVCTDSDGQMLVYDDASQRLFSTGKQEGVGAVVMTRTFFVSDGRVGEHKEIVRYVKIRYKSAHDLTVNLYVDGGSTPVKSGTLIASSVILTGGIALRYRCHSFKIEIVDATKDTGEVEIYEIKVEHD